MSIVITTINIFLRHTLQLDSLITWLFVYAPLYLYITLSTNLQILPMGLRILTTPSNLLNTVSNKVTCLPVYASIYTTNYLATCLCYETLILYISLSYQLVNVAVLTTLSNLFNATPYNAPIYLPIHQGVQASPSPL